MLAEGCEKASRSNRRRFVALPPESRSHRSAASNRSAGASMAARSAGLGAACAPGVTVAAATRADARMRACHAARFAAAAEDNLLRALPATGIMNISMIGPIRGNHRPRPLGWSPSALRRTPARLRHEPTRHARRPFLARAWRAPSTRRSLVPSRRKSLSETSLNRPRGLRAAPFGKIDAAQDVQADSVAGQAVAREHAACPEPVFYLNTAPGSSRLSEPSISRLSTPSATAARSMTRVWVLSASTASLTSALPSGLDSPSIWS